MSSILWYVAKKNKNFLCIYIYFFILLIDKIYASLCRFIISALFFSHFRWREYVNGLVLCMEAFLIELRILLLFLISTGEKLWAALVGLSWFSGYLLFQYWLKATLQVWPQSLQWNSFYHPLKISKL